MTSDWLVDVSDDRYTTTYKVPFSLDKGSVLTVVDRHVAFCEYNGSVASMICVAVATLANEKLLERASDNDLLLGRKSTSNKTCYRQWFDRCIISKMILKRVKLIISGSFFQLK